MSAELEHPAGRATDRWEPGTTAPAFPGPRAAVGRVLPLWVSVEGLNGVGKSEAIRVVAAELGPRCLRLSELTDKEGDTLPSQVIAALRATGDVFLRTGHPVVETLAFLALKVREYERLSESDLSGVEVILEDRGVDSTAIYQAVILAAQHPGVQPMALAERILVTMAPWRPSPDATVLLTGDRNTATSRFAARTGQQLDGRDLAVIEQAEVLYRDFAIAHPDRFIVLDVDSYSRNESSKALLAAVEDLIQRRETVHAS
ncbi:thymidylate kinase [Streptomyces sp. NPDC047525]|uniref:thymidylate kinase n=1 Tax=Streptomyces sp. NPDC047525 TaxID=3155264 RepID=UPI0034049819